MNKLNITKTIKKLPANWSNSEYRDKVQRIVERKINLIINKLNVLEARHVK